MVDPTNPTLAAEQELELAERASEALRTHMTRAKALVLQARADGMTSQPDEQPAAPG